VNTAVGTLSIFLIGICRCLSDMLDEAVAVGPLNFGIGDSNFVTPEALTRLFSMAKGLGLEFYGSHQLP
jgi:hypothetical protein